MSLEVAVRHRFPGFALDVAFTAPDGVTALFGRSGSGKTSVVNAVAGLLRPDAGRVVARGEALVDTGARLWRAPHRRRIGYVFQEARLFPHLSVRQNLLYGRWFARHGGDGPEFDHVVDLLGLAPLLSRRPATLSGGERQRVSIGRAILSRPRLLLMDEPLAALDEARRAEILPYLERVRDEAGIPILYVSHSVSEVARLATTVIVLDEGRVLRAGAAEDVLSDPFSAASAGIRGVGAVITGRIDTHHSDGLTELSTSSAQIFLPRVAAAVGAEIRVRIEAQDVTLSLTRPEGISALNILPCEITDIRRGEGPGVLVRLRSGADTLLARITQRSAERMGLARGTACHAVIKTVSVAPEDIGRRG
ncbi:molybdate transport system ATP-binding protein [Tranquillimonas rosea]|uniref:Molybdate transport system ATP-binding protein n=1 Tax=Tranquillimonas rosea TaxID=641238 RepID=A0A1H9WJI0_9RHOB|nr:molybdenum ABC transporter ATP-binding protein [Tranquillimonas rosea]SES33827.1 molybdate transport system ATP-binding protein [Tranquillimonas rosea]